MPTTTDLERCACGLPLHYASLASEAAMRGVITEMGPNVVVTMAEQSFWVPRHYIALHGLAAKDLPQLAVRYGWERA